jgi:hypothetical protein
LCIYLSAFAGRSGGISLNDSITMEQRVEKDVKESAVTLNGDNMLQFA